jgi:WD40 repeat protein
LAQCDYFLLLASPDSARSPWVAKEIQWWWANRPHENLLIVVTEGQIVWDAQSRDFDWERTTCLSPEMKGLQREEPLYVDLRWAKWNKQPGLRNPRFRDAILMLLAPIYGRPKDELDSEDARQQRRFKLVAAAAGLVLGILTLAAIYGTWTAEKNLLEAEKNHQEAERNHRESESRKLAIASLDAIDGDHSIDRAIILGVLAWRTARTPEAESALIKIQGASTDVARILGRHTAEVRLLAFSGDGSVFATGAEDGSIVLWRVKDWAPTGTVLPGVFQGMESMSIDQTGSSILAAGQVRNLAEDQWDNKTVLWDVSSRTYRILPSRIRRDALSPNGKLVAMQIHDPSERAAWSETLGPNGRRVQMGIDSDALAVWDATTQSLRSQVRGTPVRSVRFVDDTNLIFVTYAYVDYNPVIRVGSWNIDTGTRKLGPFLFDFALGDFTDTSAAFSGNGLKLLTSQKNDIALWAIQGDLKLSRLQRPDQLPRSVDSFPDVVFDQQGERVVIVTHTRLLAWDLARAQVIKSLRQEYGRFLAALSPDGRWLATINGANGAPVIVWDLDLTDSKDPAHSLEATCNLEGGDCIRRLCEKVSVSFDQKMLRDVLGDSSFEELDGRLRTAPCSSDLTQDHEAHRP